MPPEAMAAYDEASVSGATSSEPSVIADGPVFVPLLGSVPIGLPSLPRCSPRLVIMSRTLQAPRLATSPANAVLTENAVASVRLILPDVEPSSLRTGHTVPGKTAHWSPGG